MLRGVASEANASIVCIQETKLAVISQTLINEALGSSYSNFAYLPALGIRGGILIACRAPEARLTTRHIGSFSLTVDITLRDESWRLTSVYGPQPDPDKIQFLDELRVVQSSFSGPWMIAGDFNLLLDYADKSNDNINRRNMGPFRRFVDETEMKDVLLHRRSFTWSNERMHPTLGKLDSILVSVDMELAFPNCSLQALSIDCSDHAPLLLSVDVTTQSKRHFHFEKFWIKLPDYLQAVQRGWTYSVSDRQPLRRLDALLRNIPRELQSWG